MAHLSQAEVDQLLDLIQHPEDKKIVKDFLQSLQKVGQQEFTPKKGKINRRKTKKVLDIISKIGLEISKHKAIEWLFDFLD